MDIKDIGKIALSKGIDPAGKCKYDLIRTIQKSEGYEQCFGTKMFKCNNKNCLWRSDCQGKVTMLGVLVALFVLFVIN